MNESKKSVQKLPWIDALRGLAVFSVIMFHAMQCIDKLKYPQLYNLLNGLELGKTGVHLFYIISAFTLFYSVDNRSKLEKSPWKNFFIRRFFRIAPMFYLTCLFNLKYFKICPNFWIDDGKCITIPNLIAHFTFTNGWNPYWIDNLVQVGWSVAVEMPFYLCVPFLFKNIKSANLARNIALISYVLSSILYLCLEQHPLIPVDSFEKYRIWHGFIYQWLPNQLPFFFLGIMQFFLIKDMINNKKIIESMAGFSINKFTKLVMPLILVCLFFLIFSIVTKIYIDVSEMIFALGLVALCLFLFNNNFSPLVNKFWCYLGQISYSAYLVHINVMWLVQKYVHIFFVNLQPIIDYCTITFVTLFLTMIISSLTYKYIEIPGIALGRKLIKFNESK